MLRHRRHFSQVRRPCARDVAAAALCAASCCGSLRCISFHAPWSAAQDAACRSRTQLGGLCQRHQHNVAAAAAIPPWGEEIEPLIDEAGSFKEGALQRSCELERELHVLGVDFEFLDKPPHCTLLGPALRACKKFVLPRSQNAFDLVRTPGRAAVVAADVKRMVGAALGERALWHARCARFQAEEDAGGTALRQPLVLVLDGLRSTQNVASLLLSCEAARVTEVVLCGITPGPPDPAVLRVAGDAAAQAPQRYAPSAAVAVRDLRKKGYEVWALETTSQAVEFTSITPPQPLALVLGHEHQGVSMDALDTCDKHVWIRMRGMKNSLNVAVAGSIAIFDIVRQWSRDA